MSYEVNMKNYLELRTKLQLYYIFIYLYGKIALTVVKQFINEKEDEDIEETVKERMKLIDLVTEKLRFTANKINTVRNSLIR
jgi:hypothetical protein